MIISSFYFDQPGAHHNPQRNPYPSHSFVSDNVEVNGFLLSANILGRMRTKEHFSEWTLDDLRDFEISDAHTKNSFTFTGDGYFFSPYEITQEEQRMKWSLKFLEGSLFDWQFGDNFGCTAGMCLLNHEYYFF